MHIVSFNQFIVEKLGISEPSLIFFDILDLRTTGVFEEFINSGKKEFKKTEILDYRILRPFIKSSNEEDYSKFPVIKFELDLHFKKLSERLWEKEYPTATSHNFAVGGVASFFGNKNWSGYSKLVEPVKQSSTYGIIVNLGVSIDVNQDFDLKNSNDLSDLHDEVGATLYHELNHCFENYVRVIKKSGVLRPEQRSFDTTLTYSGENIWKFPKYIWKVFNKFNYYLYWSEFHETRANVQEIGFFIRKYPEKEFDQFRIYRIADEMEKFDHVKFYKEFLDKISTHESYKGIEDKIAERFKEMWIRSYEKNCKDFKVDPIISFKTLRKMSCLEFFKYWQKRINNAGKTIKRKAHSIKANL